MMMQVQLNGAAREVPEAVDVSGLLQFLAVTAQRVAVELNGAVVPRAQHAQTRLKPGDVVEVVTFVGGG